MEDRKVARGLPLLIPFPEDWRERFKEGEILFEDVSLVILARDLREAKALAMEVKVKFEALRDSLGDIEGMRREIADSIHMGREADALLGLLFLAARAKLHPAIHAWVLPLSKSGEERGALAVLSSSPKQDDSIRELSMSALERVRDAAESIPNST